MLQELCKLAYSECFRAPDCETFKLEDFNKAVQNAVTPYSKKSLFQFTDIDA